MTDKQAVVDAYLASLRFVIAENDNYERNERALKRPHRRTKRFTIGSFPRQAFLPSGTLVTSPNGQAKLSFLDGNLVVLDSHGAIVWESDTGGHRGAEVVMQDDGVLAIYPAGASLDIICFPTAVSDNVLWTDEEHPEILVASSHTPLWFQPQSNPIPGSTAFVDNDGHISLKAGNFVVWRVP